MAGVNKVILLGNLGRDPEVRHLDNGRAVANFSIATSETYKNKAGEKVTNTEWHNIVVRNKAAEICEKYLKKGDKIYIEGRLKTRKWQDDQGRERYSTEIQCTEFTFLTPRGESMPQTAPNQAPTKEPSDDIPSGPTDPIGYEEEEDLPF